MTFLKKCFFILSICLWANNTFAHTEGVIVDIERAALEDCHGDQFTVDNNLSKKISQIFDSIYQNNLESLVYFSSQRSDFCASAANIPGSFDPNAFAFPKTGTIIVTPSFLQHLTTDEQIASILSHEVSHIAMNHTNDPLPFTLRSIATPQILILLKDAYNLREELQNVRQNRQVFASLIIERVEEAIVKDTNTDRKTQNMVWLKEQKRFDSIPIVQGNAFSHPIFTNDPHYTEMQRICQHYGILQKNFVENHQKILITNKKLEEIDGKLKAFYGSLYRRELFTNFKEIEADEVGLEYYVRAGFDPAKYADGILMVELLSNPLLNNLEQTQSYCEDQGRQGLVTLSDDSHPSTCWRALNIANELKIHQKYYEKLRNKRKP